jgi:2-iminobutanoate/2-iminopropanoate deaminase
VTERICYGGLPVGGFDPIMSTAVRWGDLLFLSGRAPVDTATMKIVSTDFAVQTRKVLDDIVASLKEAGSGPAHVLRVQCYLARGEDFAVWNKLWVEYFPAPRPVRTTIVTGFVVPGMLVEVEVTAGVPAAK